MSLSALLSSVKSKQCVCVFAMGYKCCNYCYRYSEGPNKEVIETNVTKVVHTNKCCEDYELKGSMCVRKIDITNPCGNVTCPAVPEAKCIVFKKCDKEVALFMKEGSIGTECHDSGDLEPLSCTGVCIQDPCLEAECPAYEKSEVLCSVSGCDCQVTWIHLKDRTEVNCQTGEVISKQDSVRRRRQACQ